MRPWQFLTGRARKAAGAAAAFFDLRDVFVFGGLGMVFYGLHAMYPPAAWAGVGAVVFLVGMKRA